MLRFWLGFATCTHPTSTELISIVRFSSILLASRFVYSQSPIIIVVCMHGICNIFRIRCLTEYAELSIVNILAFCIGETANTFRMDVRLNGLEAIFESIWGGFYYILLWLHNHSKWQNAIFMVGLNDDVFADVSMMPIRRIAVVVLCSPTMLNRKYADAECVVECVCCLFDAFTHYSRMNDHKRLVEFPLIKTTASMKCLKFVLLGSSTLVPCSWLRLHVFACGRFERTLSTIRPLQKMIHRNDGTIRWMDTQIASPKAIPSATQSFHYKARSPSTIHINHRWWSNARCTHSNTIYVELRAPDRPFDAGIPTRLRWSRKCTKIARKANSPIYTRTTVCSVWLARFAIVTNACAAPNAPKIRTESRALIHCKMISNKFFRCCGT